MTPQQLQERIDGQLSEWAIRFAPLAEAVLDLKGQMFVRIFGSGSSGGENSAGATLPTQPYSTEPIYVSPRSVRSAPAQFKVGKRGKKIESLYFPNGYSQLKQSIPSAKLPLELTGRLKSGFLSEPVTEDGYSASIALPSSEAGKAEGLERQYGAIFLPTQQEQDDFLELHAQLIVDAINDLLQ